MLILWLWPQETDYMGVVFHFYDSGEEDEEEEEPTPRTNLSVFPGALLSPLKSYSRAGHTSKAAEMKWVGLITTYHIKFALFSNHIGTLLSPAKHKGIIKICSVLTSFKPSVL